MHAHGVVEITNGIANLAGGHSHSVSYANGTGGANTRASESTNDAQDGTYNTNAVANHTHTVSIPAFDTNVQYERDFVSD